MSGNEWKLSELEKTDRPFDPQVFLNGLGISPNDSLLGRGCPFCHFRLHAHGIEVLLRTAGQIPPSREARVGQAHFYT